LGRRFETTGRKDNAMRYVRLFAGPDGESHFEDIAVELTPIAEYAKGVPLVYISASRASNALTFLSAPPGFFGDWHAAPRQQFMIKLAGQTEFVASDGERREIGPGTVLLIEDTSGKGHTSRVLGPGDDEWFVAGLDELERS
jgi:hypothetical protein